MTTSSLQGVILRAERRGFTIDMDGLEQHQPPRHARRQKWFAALPVEDQATVTAWLWAWARQEWNRRHLVPAQGRGPLRH